MKLWIVESREASPSVAVGILQLLLSLLAQMKLRQLRLPLLHAQVLRHAQSLVIHLSLGLVLRGISNSLPRTVLIHETLLAIAVMTVASLKIAHVSNSPLAIVQATDGDSLQEIYPFPMRLSSSRASSDDEYFGESPSRSSPGESPSRSSPAPVRAMVDFILQTFPEYQASPSHPLSRSFKYLLLRTWLKRFPRRSDSPVILRMGRLATPFCILSTSLKGSQIRPLRGRN